MSEIVLRPYQEKFIDNIRAEFNKGQKRVVGVAPCGAGKTIMTGWMIRETERRGKTAIFFVHRKELIEQTSETFSRLNIPHGIIAGGVKPHYQFPVQIASVQTLKNRMHLLNPPTLLVCDECHHILANTYKYIINTWNDSFLLGVTATPERTGGIKLCDIFTSMVQAPPVAELIRLGNLTHFEYFTMDIEIERGLEKLEIINGDYATKGLSALMNDPLITSAIACSYIEHAQDKSAICYCVDVEHSQDVATYFNSIGIPAAHCDGNTHKDERKKIVEDFRLGKYKILCNAELFGEGFDVPNCHAVILARPTKSKILHIQQSMRSMRPDPTDPQKVAIIIDCVKNYAKHGYPDDPQDWSLDPNKKKGEGVAPTKICPYCLEVIPAPSVICPECGARLIFDEVKDATVAEQIYSSEKKINPAYETPEVIHAPEFMEKFQYFVDIGLKSSKVTKPNQWAAFQTAQYAKSYDELLALARLADFKKGWAYHQAIDLKIPITS